MAAPRSLARPPFRRNNPSHRCSTTRSRCADDRIARAEQTLRRTITDDISFCYRLHDAMRYLILAAGIGKRMGSVLAGRPKCLIDIDGEPLIGRLLRQIRAHDAHADVHVVLGYKSDLVAPLLDGCSIVIN